MKTDPTKKIEAILQQAPTPTPPKGLRQQLIQDSENALLSHKRRQTVGTPSFFGIWIPRLGFALFFTMAAVFITAQSNRQPSLVEAKHSLKQLEVERDQLNQNLEQQSKLRERLDYLETLKQQQTEVVQLQQERDTLTSLLSEVTELTAANQSLQRELHEMNGLRELLSRDPLGEAREEARHVKCINNLKNLGLAYHRAKSQDILATGIHDLLPLLANAKMLDCPNSDMEPNEAILKQGELESGVSYIWKLNSPDHGTSSTVLIQCAFHNSLCMLDGSVQSGERLENGEMRLVDDRGNLKIERTTH